GAGAAGAAGPAGDRARTVFIGDGLSDRCGARAADVVYAKGDLLAFCRDAGIPARPFANFEDVARAEGLSLAHRSST
ncbi:MAG: hypothetical protein ACREOU_05990, partial [Candidatus Eiseniibacteriota bacterium]